MMTLTTVANQRMVLTGDRERFAIYHIDSSILITKMTYDVTVQVQRTPEAASAGVRLEGRSQNAVQGRRQEKRELQREHRHVGLDGHAQSSHPRAGRREEGIVAKN